MRIPRSLYLAGVICSLGLLTGCAGMEYVPGGPYFFYHKELPASKRAVEAARSAGKDKECPAEFQAAEKLMKEAYKTYYACHTREAIAMANEAIAKANALCPKPVVTPSPVPPAQVPAPAAAPTVSLSAASSSVDAGACTNLTWSTTNARSASIDGGVGSVGTSGTRQVCPSTTTRYTLTATGDGGTRTDSATVAVTPRAAPVDRLTIHVNFDTNKSTIRKADVGDLEQAERFVKKYPNCKVEVDGYTDSTGSDALNMGLSERRADAVKNYLVEHHDVATDKITTKGLGKANPVADNKTAKGRSENRRAEILIFCQ